MLMRFPVQNKKGTVVAFSGEEGHAVATHTGQKHSWCSAAAGSGAQGLLRCCPQTLYKV